MHASLRTLCLLLLFGLWPLPARADAVVVPKMPTDLAQVDVYLLTVGRGERMDALFGHTILRVVDRAGDTDLSFNWGIFDFSDPWFIWRFYRGDLRYSLGIYDLQLLIDYYRNVEHRSMVQDQLLLTSKQKQVLLERLIDNAQPANLTYQYSQLRDNCSTRPRDHLDAALAGKIRERYEKKPAHTTFRGYLRTSTSPLWWVAMGLDLLTNDVLDQPLSKWDEMFLPGKLRQHLRELPAFDDNGRPIAGSNLLGEARTLIDLPEPANGRDPYPSWMLLVAAPLIGLLVLCVDGGSERRTATVLAVVSLTFGFWSALWGTLFAQNWVYSQYTEVKHNALLWLLWPTDWLFVAYGWHLLRHRQRPAKAARLMRLVKAASALHVISFALGAVLWAFGVVTQGILPMLATSGVFGLFYYATIWRRGAAGEP